MPEQAALLMDGFWPGPLSIILKKNSNLPNIVTAGTDTVAVRLTSNAFLRELISEFGNPIVAPSANMSGATACKKAEDVVNALSGKVDMIIEDDGAIGGEESTLVDMTGDGPVIIREGAVSSDEIMSCCLKGHSII